jgi:sugar diacid utilization regulator
VTLSDVVRQLAARGASGLAIRGQVDTNAIEVAEEMGLPLLRLPDNAALHDIEQEIMHECALMQARHEIMAADQPGAWITRLLAGKTPTFAEAQAAARREGFTLSPTYRVALVAPLHPDDPEPHGLDDITTTFAPTERKRAPAVIARPFEEGLVMLVPPGQESALTSALHGGRLACGLGTDKPLLDVPTSLEEARLALLSSQLIHEGKPVRYERMGIELLVVLLYKDHRPELGTFVEQTLGPLLRHDARSGTPLLPTVASFVAHGGRLRETAADIYVHRNTLAYRLDRASEILNADLKDADARLAIEIALRALPLARQGQN